MKQMTLPYPLSHTKDPQTSYDAAEKMIKSGELNKQEEYVLNEIRDYMLLHQTFTPKEVADYLVWKRLWEYTKIYQIIQRRLSGLRNKGKIERIQIGKERIGATQLFKPIYQKRDGCCVWKLTN